MAATKAMKVWGTVLKFNSNTVGEIENVGSADFNREFIEVFTLDSDDETAEFITSGITPGQLSLDVIFDGVTDGVYSKLKTDFTAGTKATLEITYKNGSKISCDAILAKLPTPGGAAKGGKQMYNLVFQMSGSITYTPVAA